MSLQQDLENIREIGSTAWHLASQGEFRNARRTIKKLRNSFYVSETQRFITLVEALIDVKTGNLPAAKTKILENVGYLWGISEGWDILALSNPTIDSNSQHYYIEILGGLATVGVFTQFSEEHVASFDVIANSQEEALQYIEEVANFADSESKQVQVCRANPLPESSELEQSGLTNRGVIKTHPFRLIGDEQVQ